MQPETKPAAESVAVDESGTHMLNELLEGRKTSYVPLAEKQEVSLSTKLVLTHLCVPTKAGHYPNESEVLKYIMLCRQRGLNPWVGDCYLLGYDTEDGPKFSMVVAIQALLKRAEIARTTDGQAAFDGLESGVIVQFKGEDGKPQIAERYGDLVITGEELIGGWAKVYRKDRRVPFYQRLKLQTYAKPYGVWKKDAAGMLCKCAESAALRQAFPSDVGGLYLASEIEAFATQAKPDSKATGTGGAIDLDALIAKQGQPATPQIVQDAKDDLGADPEVIAQGDAAAALEHEAQAYTELGPWATDVATAATNGRLDQIVEAAKDQQAGLRTEILKMVEQRRAEIKAAKAAKK